MDFFSEHQGLALAYIEVTSAVLLRGPLDFPLDP